MARTGSNPQQKPVILLNIDTLMPVPLEIGVQTGRAPALKYLIDNGKLFTHMVSAFPTMSVTIDSTLLTGTYPDRHHVPGLVWYHQKENRFVNYGTGIREAFKIGGRQCIEDMFSRLNQEHLSPEVSTIFEDLSRKGYATGSINSFLYRGNTRHKMTWPKWFSTLTRIDRTWETQAPDVFSLGALSRLRPNGFSPQIFAGDYKFTLRELKYLIHKKMLPSFTFFTVQDLDLRTHTKGIMDLRGIQKIDRELANIFNMYRSWDDALSENIWIVMSDNGHAPMGTNMRKFLIHLPRLFRRYTAATPDRPIENKVDLVFCVNQRMVYIYKLNPDIKLEDLVRILQQDQRIDVIAWKGNETNYVVSGAKEGNLSFRPGGQIRDPYGQSWHVEGNTTLLNMDIHDNGKIKYGDYPDALSRLYGALHSHQGKFIVATAQPGCEFRAKSTPFHIGGAAHGSLHKQESLVPLIVSGTDEFPLPERIVDLKAWILRLMMRDIS
jgi:hypothetical protein